jgi:DNA-binding beta-propeller fold protein YncE
MSYPAAPVHSFAETREVIKKLTHALLLTLMVVAAGESSGQATPWTFSSFGEPVRDVAFDANGIAYVTSETTITRVDPVSREALGTLRARGARLTQVVPEPGGCRLAVTDAAGGTNRVFMIDSIGAPALREVALPTLPSGQFGTWSLAWVGPDDLLVSGRFSGSGWVHLRRVNVTTGHTQILNNVRQDSMLSADATRTHVLVAESNISSGPVSVLDPTTGSARQSISTNWFLWDVPFDGSVAVAPTYSVVSCSTSSAEGCSSVRA